ncbi:MAG: endonuclease/exonuclease/phosphatase family protein [Pseudomonadota bacterium]
MDIESTLWFAVDALWLATLMCWAANLWWVFDLASHFRQQYLLAAVLVAAWALIAGFWYLAVLALLAALPHLLEVLRTAQPADLPQARQGGIPFRLATFNLAYPNHNAATVDRYVAELEPDLLLLQEADLDWPGPRSGERLHHACQALKTTGDHLFLLSRWPFTAWMKARSASTGTPLIVARVEIAGQAVTVVNFHAASPKTGAKARFRNLHFRDLAARMAEIEGPKIIAGDFNCSPWSPYYRELVEALNMVNVAQGRAWFWTWPAAAFCFGIPIDHVLVSRHFSVRSLSRGPRLGSDHLPIIADLELRPLA